MRILVTGGAGFIGSHLCERLVARGDDVVAVDNFDPFYDPAVKRRNLAALEGNPRFRLVEGDVCEPEALDAALGGGAFDLVVHLAARAGVRPSLERPLDYVRTNVEGTAAMLELARKRGTGAFVLGSSSSVYGDAAHVPFSESDPVGRPISPYAASKRGAELLGHTYAHLYGMSVLCLRFFTVYGPRQRPDLAIHKFARLMAAGGEVPVYGDGTTERDYTYVDDVVQGVEGAIRYALAHPGAFEVVNLGESRTVSLAELLALLVGALGVEPRIRRLPPQPGDVARTFASVDKARSLLGYDPRVPIEEGIRRFVRWLAHEGAVPA
ncbi:MAG TPA: NAD-dependent epimerase/dehydratase family protein [Longimicrobiaceae bacterium]|nr:NAD-dependent epimerase/dehydratase family protein [Longimicrobiaceae bacterium]